MDVTFDESGSLFNHSYYLGESLKGEEPLFELFISSRAKFLLESLFVRSPEFQSLNPNEPIEFSNPNIDNGILENNLPLQVYSRRKRQVDQASSCNHLLRHEAEFIQPSDLALPIAFRKGTRYWTQQKHPLSLSKTYQNLSPSHKTFLCNLHSIPIP